MPRIKLPKTKIPISVVGVFALLTVLALYGFVKDFSTYYGVKPFGFIENVVAQVATVLGVTETPGATGSYKIVDSWGRAQVINPGNKNDPIKTVAELNGNIWGMDLINKAGYNPGDPLANIDQLLADIEGNGPRNKKTPLEMSYTIGIAVNPSEVGSAVKFITESNDKGYMPIIRLCYVGGCSFTDPESIKNFYLDIVAQIEGSDYQFIAVLGPNEPGTGTPSEMSGFGVPNSPDGYRTLIERANSAAEALQPYRGSNVWLAPAIFNIPNRSAAGFDRNYYMCTGALKADLYDYLLGNTYNVAGQLADVYYTEDMGCGSMKSYAEANDLKTIITEFGYFDSTPGIENLKKAYNNLCNDDTVDGIMFFRPFKNPDSTGSDNAQSPIDPEDVADIIAGCSATPQKTSASKRWVNANFDSCVPTDVSSTLASSVLAITTSSACPKNRTTIINFGDSLSDESAASFSEATNVSFPGQGAADFYPGSQYYDKLLDETFNSKVLQANAFAVRVLIGTNDCGSGDLASFEKAYANILGRIKSSGAIPIAVSIPARRENCGSVSLGEWNAKIRSVANSIGAEFIDADAMYSNTDLRDDRHLNSYTKLNDATRSLLKDLETTCGVNLNVSEPTTDTPTIASITRYVDYNQEFSLGTPDAVACGTKFKNTSDATYAPSRGPSLLLAPDGTGFSIKAETYMDVFWPGKSIGSNNPVNSALKRSYTPPSVSVASYFSGNIRIEGVDNGFYDPLNQFAGALTSLDGSDTYPLPWAGNAFQAMGQFLFTMPEFAKYGVIPIKPSDASKIDKAPIEANSDESRNLSIGVSRSYGNYTSNTEKIPDERAICYVDPSNVNSVQKCFDNSAFSIIKTTRQYDPYLTPKNYQKVEVSSCNGAITLSNKDDLVPGPKVKVKSYSENFSSSEVCWNFGMRNKDGIVKERWSFKYDKVTKADDKAATNLSCRIHPTATVKRSVFNSFLGTYQVVDVRCTSIVPNCNFATGNCAFPGDADIKQTCFEMTQYKGTEEIYVKPSSSPYSEFKDYSIAQANDALYGVYTKLQNELSARGIKFVPGEDTNVAIKTLLRQTIHDAQKKNNSKYISSEVTSTPYWYTGESGEQCVNDKSKFFDNSMPVANGKAVIEQEQYYSWMGYLDVMWEMLMVYSSGTTLPAERIVDRSVLLAEAGVNSSTNVDGTANSDFLDTKFLQSGLASQTLSFPLLSCDEVMECKRDNKSPLCPIEGIELEENRDYPCIARVGDDRIGDGLADYLCQNGYIVEGRCQNICKATDLAPGKDLPKSCPFELVYPLQGGQVRLTSNFGPRESFDTPEGRTLPYHFGVDFPIDANTGDQVVAAHAGKVAFAGDAAAFGLMIKIEDPATGWTSLYAHNSALYVTVGDTVTQGQVIAKGGTTGKSTGPHVHFELRKTRSCINDAYNPDGSCSIDPEPCFVGSVTGSPNTNGSTDTSTDLTLFPVGRTTAIPNCQEPSRLVGVSTDRPIFNDTSNPNGTMQLTPDANTALQSMLSAMKSQNQEAYNSCGFNWGYRSAELQDSFGACGSKDTACACHSEHQLGTTVDFRPSDGRPVNQFSTTACYQWVQANAHNYGFVQSYTDGNPDYATEPWHWRWITTSKAQDFKQNINKYSYLIKYLESLNGGSTGSNSGGGIPSSAQCVPLSNTDKTTPSNIFELSEKVGKILDIPKELLIATLSIESQSLMADSMGNNVSNPAFAGDPNQIVVQKQPSVNVAGPTQALCSTFLAYGAPPGTTSAQLPPDMQCQFPTGGIGKYYSQTLQCVQALGMNVKNGDILDRTVMGHALCFSGVMFKVNVGSFPQSEWYSNTNFDNSNKIWRSGVLYLCGSQSSCAQGEAGASYGNALLGRYLLLNKEWQNFVSGTKDMTYLRNYCAPLGRNCT